MPPDLPRGLCFAQAHSATCDSAARLVLQLGWNVKFDRARLASNAPYSPLAT